MLTYDDEGRSLAAEEFPDRSSYALPSGWFIRS
jgi:hypothetical protein